MSALVLSRGDIKKTPGRLVYDAGSNATVSMFSKLGTMIERQRVHEVFAVGTDAGGELDYRDKEFYDRVRITPDGRFGANLCAKLWPYGNYTAGQPIFATGADKTLEIHGIDTSKDIFASSAVEVMPTLKFTATETIVGQAEFLCLRGDGDYWSTTNSLVTQADTGGSMTDTDHDGVFTDALVLTGPYVATWAAGAGLNLTTFDTLDGFTVEFSISWSDDTRQAIGLTNRRIKVVTARVRCTPLGADGTATTGMRKILTALQGQGSGAFRGRSIRANCADFIIYPLGNDGTIGTTPMFNLKGAGLVEDKESWSTESVRNTDLVWHGTRAFTAGAIGPLFTVLS